MSDTAGSNVSWPQKGVPTATDASSTAPSTNATTPSKAKLTGPGAELDPGSAAPSATSKDATSTDMVPSLCGRAARSSSERFPPRDSRTLGERGGRLHDEGHTSR